MPTGANAPGWTAIEVDSAGRLAYLLAAPETEWKPKPLDWRPLLDAAKVDAASLRPVTPLGVPAAPFDARAAWIGSYVTGSSAAGGANDRAPMRIEAAAWKGTPVFFAVSAPDGRAAEPAEFGSRTAERFMGVLELIVVAVAVLLAVRNVRARRGDRQGAVRVAIALFVIAGAAELFHAAGRTGVLAAASDLAPILGNATRVALYMLVAYLAVEPYVRRRWPELLISWARLVGGRPRDPLVARHVLIGLLGGFGHAILSATARPIAAALDGGSAEFRQFLIGNPWDALAAVFGSTAGALMSSTMIIILLMIFMIVLRRRALAGAALFLVYLTFFWLSVAQRPASIPSYLAIASLLAFVMLRYGLVAITVTQATFFALFRAPLLPGAGWATATAPVTLATVIALALWAFHTSLGGQPMFSSKLLDE